MSDPPEQPLVGGYANSGLVVRVGDTVRRPWRPTAPATAALLRHLERVGFPGAPRALGVDGAGREVLSYVPGDVPMPPYPSWALTDEALDSVAVLLRDYHDAVASFDWSAQEWPPAAPQRFGHDLVSHNDPNLDNVVFRDGRAVALLDFDLASPGSRLWDVAAAVRLWGPLRADEDIRDARRGSALQRARRVLDAYGLDRASRRRVVDAVVANHDWLYAVVRRGAEAGNPGLAAYWATDAAERSARTRDWYVRSEAVLRAALA